MDEQLSAGVATALMEEKISIQVQEIENGYLVSWR
jgi:hypothetical protein